MHNLEQTNHEAFAIYLKYIYPKCLQSALAVEQWEEVLSILYLTANCWYSQGYLLTGQKHGTQLKCYVICFVIRLYSVRSRRAEELICLLNL